MRQYIHHITENILNLVCPSCNAAFLDFSGCCSVQCSTCSNFFCGLCLKKCDNSSLCHSHVLKCGLNPDSSNYFCSTDTLAKVHRRARVEKLVRYFNDTIPKGEVKRKVFKQCEQILADVGISRSDIFG